jgi:transcriptional antiterminator NusG
MPDTELPPDSPAPVAPAEASAAPPAPSEPPAEDVQTPEAAHEPAAEPPPPEPEAAVATEETPEDEPEATPTAHAPDSNKRWYVVKVQSGREDSIKEAIERRVKIEGLEEYYGEIIIPTETVVEMRRGKRVKKDRKLYPGYLMANVEYNDRILYLFRETSGVGDFVGGTITRPPPPMSQREIDTMLRKNKPDSPDGPKVVPTKPEFSPGDRVKVKDGAFAGMEGEVKELLEAKGQVRVEVAIFGRPVSLELEYWQVEPV